MGVIVGVLIGLGMIACWWGLRRTKILHPGESEPSLRAQFAVVRSNRIFRTLLGAFFLQALATSSMLAGAQYFATYVLGREGMSDVLFACLVAPGLLFVPIWAKIAHRLGKKRGYLIASLTFLVGTLLLLGSRVLPIPMSSSSVAICGVGYAGMQMFPLSMLPDAIAVDAAESGRRRAGAYTGFWTAGETTGFAIGPALVLGLLAVTGLVSSTAGTTVTQPASAVTGTLLAFTVLPAILLLASLPLVLKYNLTDERIAAALAAPPWRTHQFARRAGDDIGHSGDPRGFSFRRCSSARPGSGLRIRRRNPGSIRGGHRRLDHVRRRQRAGPDGLPERRPDRERFGRLGLDLLGGPPGAQGVVTSGGTESCWP